MRLPPLDSEDLAQDLGWHALNYRTAHPLHAEEMWQELKRYVENWGESCARMAREEERERCARICESVNNHDTPMTANDCADEIRAGATSMPEVRFSQAEAAIALLRRIRYHAQRHALPRDWLTAADEVLGTWGAVTTSHPEVAAAIRKG